MNWKLLCKASLVIALILLCYSLVLYEENAALRLRLSNVRIRDETPRVGIAIPLPDEAEPIFAMLNKERDIVSDGFNFSVGTIADRPVVIVVCGIGEEAAAAAALAMHTLFTIQWAVNIGTSGAHSPSLEVGDVIVVSRIVNPSQMMMHSATNWVYRTDGVTYPNRTQFRFLYLNTTGSLVELAERASNEIQLPPTPPDLTGTRTIHQPVVLLNGTLSSSDLWIANSTLISVIRSMLATDAEESEAYGFAQTCYRLGIPFIKIAVISNSELSGSSFTPETLRVSMMNGAVLLRKMIELSKPWLTL